MRIKTIVAGALLAAVIGLGSASQADTAGTDTCDLNDPYCHRFSKAEEYFKKLNPEASEEEWLTLRGHLRAFTDPARLSAVMADPVKFADWLTALSDPDAVHLMVRCMQEPVMWNTWMRVMTNPEKMMQAGMVFMNPMVYFNWMMAPMNQQVYAKLEPLTDDQLWADWSSKLDNGTFYEPLYAWTDPQWSVDRVTWAVDPSTYGNMFAWFAQGFNAYPAAAPVPTTP